MKIFIEYNENILLEMIRNRFKLQCIDWELIGMSRNTNYTNLIAFLSSNCNEPLSASVHECGNCVILYKLGN